MKRSNLTAAVLCGALLFGGSYTALPYAPVSVAYAAQQTTVMQAGKVLTINAIVDSSVSTVTKDDQGVVVCPTIKSALDKVKNMNLEQSVIMIRPGTYREKLKISQPNLTLVGTTSPEYTTIVFDDAEGTPVRAGDTATSKSLYGLSGCPSVTVKSDALNFQAINITFANDFVPEDHPEMKNRQALAIKNESDSSSFWNCRFLGRQDTLYANAGCQYYKNCYIEGDIDFIFGAATAVYEDCEIRSLDRDTTPKGYVTAPSTLEKNKGFLFYHCNLTSNFDEPGAVMLGRPWHPSSATSKVSSAAVFHECTIGAHIARWDSMGNKDGVSDPVDNRMFEYHNTGDGAKRGGNRRQLTDAQAKEYTVSAYLGQWRPEELIVK